MEINENKIPTRKPKKTFRSVTGYFPSKKNGRSMFFESMLEKKLFLTLEFDNDVVSYLEQPIKIEYKNKNRNTSYHPDCLINYKNKESELIEVKYSTDLVIKKDELKPKFDIARKYAQENGLLFKTFTEQNIDELVLLNMEFLYSFAFTSKNEEYESKILNVIEGNNIKVKDLLNNLTTNKFEQAKYLPYVWALCFTQILYIDYLQDKITMNSTVRIGNE